MIKLTTGSGRKVYVSPYHISMIFETGDSDTTGISLNGEGDDDSPSFKTFVTEFPEEVTRKILEYKLAMVRYGVAMKNGEWERAGSEWSALEELAGLEDSGHDQ
ncbi:hypothetical protein [Cohnella cholangitidis]|uniref:Uncharacterized protein n=1 Tax=Cohnella cholangitidis TaxID=2598458 RepID=A0A7G5BTE6_9BACL|nr:hypothetical protein [Cohnella cholangitidis]QMV40230.1 hypothetical protein FPL14_02710 [Cohnella cholangitidis]